MELKDRSETWKRCWITFAAYAYEINDDPIMEDHEFDQLARLIDLSVDTTRPDLDKWFKENFRSNTGSWIHNHPELDRIDGRVRMIPTIKNRMPLGASEKPVGAFNVRIGNTLPGCT